MSELTTNALSCFNPEALAKAPSRKEIYGFVCELAEASQGSLVDEINKLIDRVKALEARDSAFKGVHQRAQSYAKGDFVTHGGNLWCALKAASPGDIPGNQPDTWQLAAKGK